MNQASEDEKILLFRLAHFTFRLRHAMEKENVAFESYNWVEQSIYDIEHRVVTLDDDHLIDPSNVVYSVILHLLNSSCKDMYKLAKLHNSLDSLLIELVMARKYYLFPNMVDL